MKGMKGKLLKKLKTIKTIGYVKSDRILQITAAAADEFVENIVAKSKNFKVNPTHFSVKENATEKSRNGEEVQEPEIIDASELMKDLEDDEQEDGFDDEKENIKPEKKSENRFGFSKIESSSKLKKKNPLSEIDSLNFRPPDLDSSSLFDPYLLAAFEQAVMEVKVQETEGRGRGVLDQEPIEENLEENRPLKARKIEEIKDPLLDFEYKCPPGGEGSVILYTTGLRGIRKTFEDCTSIRFLLQSFRVLYFERDVSMHSEFREELWRTLGEKVVPPRLFIKGRYVGGAEVVLVLHEQGKFRRLFNGIPLDCSERPCDNCSGVRFVMCFRCNGSRKLVNDGTDEVIQCQVCNENGLIICPFCC